jgi:cytochrome c553
MRKWMKRAGIGAGSLIAALVLGVIAIYAASELRFRRAYDEVAVTPLRGTPPADAVERGRHLATAIGKCVECHGSDLGGKEVFDAGPLGFVVASNLTRGRGGVASRYTDAQLERAIRHGLNQDGRALAVMPSEAYYAMNDADVQAVIAYLRSVPPVDRELRPTTLRALGRALYLAGKLPLFPAEAMNHQAPRGEPVPAGPTLAYGQYLVTIGGCNGCHGPDLAGTVNEHGPPGAPNPPNLTPAGEVGRWSEQDFTHALRTGKRPNGTVLNAAMPWALAGQMSDDEMHAVWLYLRSVPPKASASE